MLMTKSNPPLSGLSGLVQTPALPEFGLGAAGGRWSFASNSRLWWAASLR